MSDLINDGIIDKIVIRHSEGEDVLPANNRLSRIELALVQAMSRESILRQYINEVKEGQGNLFCALLFLNEQRWF